MNHLLSGVYTKRLGYPLVDVFIRRLSERPDEHDVTRTIPEDCPHESPRINEDSALTLYAWHGINRAVEDWCDSQPVTWSWGWLCTRVESCERENEAQGDYSTDMSHGTSPCDK